MTPPATYNTDYDLVASYVVGGSGGRGRLACFGKSSDAWNTTFANVVVSPDCAVHVNIIQFKKGLC